MENNHDSKKFLFAAVIIFALFLILGIFIFLIYTKKKESGITIPITPFAPFFESQQIYPADILNLSNWKITLPIQQENFSFRDEKKSPEPLEIKQPELTAYKLDPWFTVTPDKKGVVFRAAVNALSTGNSDYPRSELREMTANGEKEIFWPSTSGTHTLFLDQAITAVPKNKSEVVAGQIHGDDNDIMVIRLDNPKLYLARGKSNLASLDENYTLGKRFTIKFVIQNGQVMVYYNDSSAPVYTLEKKVKMAYFKVGIYPQSNCETEKEEGDEGEEDELCNDNNYGEVVVYQLNITHEGIDITQKKNSNKR